MSIELNIENQFLYSVTKALRAKNDQVWSLTIFTCLILLTWKLNQSNSFILLPSWSKSTIMDWKNHKKKHAYCKNHSKSLNENSSLCIKFK
jgi:hypothetical protein